MYTALVKPGIIFLQTYIILSALSPPPSPPSSIQDRERHWPTGLKHVAIRIIRSFRPITKVSATIHLPCLNTDNNLQLVFVLNLIIESTSIIAATFPSPTSSRILDLLTYSPNTPVSLFSPSLLWAVGMTIAIAGGMLRKAAFRALGDIWANEPAVLKEHRLVTTGPYTVTRHPACTGILSLMWGSTLALAAPGSWAREVFWKHAMESQNTPTPWMRILAVAMLAGQPVVVIAIIMTVRQEEVMLKRWYEKQWNKWAAETPWLLIPWIY
jgi:protein-S-isoprenylcysteine O-methyltransferase Ste14